MGTASVHEGVRRMRESLVGRWERGDLTQVEAAEMLRVSVRTSQRWTARFEEAGADGLADRRLGRPSPRRAPAEELERMLGLYRDKYSDCTVKHFHEQLQKRHDYVLGYTVTKLALHAAGLVRPAPKRSAHRKKRPRRPLRGMLLHQDGSRHDRLEGQPALDLLRRWTMPRARSCRCSWWRRRGRPRRSGALREVLGLYIDAAVQSAEIMSQDPQGADYSHDATIVFGAQSPKVRFVWQRMRVKHALSPVASGESR